MSLISDRTKGGKQQEAKPVEAKRINRPSEESRTRRPLNHDWVLQMSLHVVTCKDKSIIETPSTPGAIIRRLRLT